MGICEAPVAQLLLLAASYDASYDAAMVYALYEKEGPAGDLALPGLL